MSAKINAAGLTEFLEREFPQLAPEFGIDEVGAMRGQVRMKVDDRHLRPGGTVSGPTMFALADFAAYVTILAQVGLEALSVTTNCSIDFMRKPAAGADLVAACRVLKLGKALAVVDVMLHSEGMDAPVARATLTYSMPPRGSFAK